MQADDEEVANDQMTDELSAYFNGKRPKILVTTSERAVGVCVCVRVERESELAADAMRALVGEIDCRVG